MRTSLTFPVTGLILAGIMFGATATQSHAADDAYWDGPTDLRLSGAKLDSDYDYDASGSVLGIRIEDDGTGTWDDSWRAGLVIQGMQSPDREVIGLSTGLGLFYNQLQNDGDTRERYESLSAQLRVGMAVAINEHVHLEVLPFAGVGAARGELGDVDSGDPDLYWEYGAEAGAYVTLSRLQFGVQAGWLCSGFDLEYDDESEFNGAPIEDAEFEIRTSGPYVGASIGIRL